MSVLGAPPIVPGDAMSAGGRAGGTRTPEASRRRARAWVRQRVRIALPLVLAGFWLTTPTRPALVLGAAVACVGLLVRAAAAGTLRKHGTLVTWGPYAFTRHPLYLGSTLMAVGLAIAAHSWPTAALIAIYVALFYAGAVQREERKLRARYGDSFTNYAARVPCVGLRFVPLGAAHFAWSWQTYRGNREYQAALGLLIGLALLALKSAW
jgi:protein-S-isoprenylcysteine O-methyltransferase Ste14